MVGLRRRGNARIGRSREILCESEQFIGMTTSRSRSAGRIVLAYNQHNAAAYRGTNVARVLVYSVW